MARTITHTQYEELVKYDDMGSHWLNGGPLVSLVGSGLIVAEQHDRSFHHITSSGWDALAAYRERWGIKVAAMREP